MDTYSCCADFAQLPRMKAIIMYTIHSNVSRIEKGGLRSKLRRLAKRVPSSIVISGKKAKAARKRIRNVSTTYYTTL